jgi:hypothetical protein
MGCVLGMQWLGTARSALLLRHRHQIIQQTSAPKRVLPARNDLFSGVDAHKISGDEGRKQP